MEQTKEKRFEEYWKVSDRIQAIKIFKIITIVQSIGLLLMSIILIAVNAKTLGYRNGEIVEVSNPHCIAYALMIIPAGFSYFFGKVIWDMALSSMRREYPNWEEILRNKPKTIINS